MKNLRRVVFAVVFSVMLCGIVYAAGISDELFAATKINDVQKVKELISGVHRLMPEMTMAVLPY